MQNRREFLLIGAGVTAASMLSSPSHANPVSRTPVKTSTPLPVRMLGKLQVSAIGLGVQNMSRKYDTSVPNRKEMHQVIRTAYEQGVTFFDAAEAYGPFEVERILGEGVKSFRNQVVIATKFGWNIDQQTGARLPGLNSRPEHIKLVVDAMLRRLQTDRIDLLYQHRVDPHVPIEDVAGAVADLMQAGKVLHWGLSEMGPNTLKRAHATLPVSAVQSEYSMLWRGPEQTTLHLCEALGIGFVPWSPLGVQFLTGWIDSQTRFAAGDFRATESRFSPENLAHNMKLVALIQQWAQRKAATPSQIALAWLLHQKVWIAPIPGTTSQSHLLQNIGAAHVQFSKAELTELTAALNGIVIRGQRLPDFVQAFSDVEAPLKPAPTKS